MLTAAREVSVFGDAIAYFNEAASLLDLGLRRATDVVGGYHALKAEGYC